MSLGLLPLKKKCFPFQDYLCSVRFCELMIFGSVPPSTRGFHHLGLCKDYTLLTVGTGGTERCSQPSFGLCAWGALPRDPLLLHLQSQDTLQKLASHSNNHKATWWCSLSKILLLINEQSRSV